MRFCLFSFTAARNTRLILLRPEIGSVLSFITAIRPLCFHQNNRQQKLLYCRKYDYTFVVFNSPVVSAAWYSFCEVSVMWQHFECSCLTECDVQNLCSDRAKPTAHVSGNMLPHVSADGLYTFSFMWLSCDILLSWSFNKIVCYMKREINQNSLHCRNHTKPSVRVLCIDEFAPCWNKLPFLHWSTSGEPNFVHSVRDIVIFQLNIPSGMQQISMWVHLFFTLPLCLKWLPYRIHSHTSLWYFLVYFTTLSVFLTT